MDLEHDEPIPSGCLAMLLLTVAATLISLPLVFWMIQR